MFRARDAEGLVGLLEDPERDCRAAAARALGKLGDPAGIPGLMGALGDEELPVRQAAATALAALGERAVPALVHSLEGQGGRLAPYALWALGEIGSPAALEALEAAAGARSWRLRWSAVEALGDVGGLRAVSLLIGALGDRDERVQNAAVLSLQQIGELAVEPLAAALRHRDPRCRPGAWRALAGFEHPLAQAALRRQQLSERIPVILVGVGAVLLALWLLSTVLW